MRQPIAILLAALALGAPPASAAGHEHGHGPAKLQLDHGRKWPTDEALRRHMAALAEELAAKVPAIHAGRLPAAEYAALGQTIEARIADIVGQCKLAPEADAMLHLVIAELGGAADALQGKAPGKPIAAAHRAVKAVNDYGRYFHHPGWKPVK